jgi:hypothetical protein
MTKKYRLAKWRIICRPKDQGRWLLGKWLFNLINTYGTLQQLLRNMYMENKSITQVNRKPGDSQF